MNKKWSRLRHQIILFLAKIVVYPYLRFVVGFRFKKFKKLKEPCIYIYNHQTVYDQFFNAYICNLKTYHVMSDDITVNGFISKLLNFVLHPIPYKKASTDFNILKICKKVINEGCSIVISQEGNRTYSGKTEYINPTISRFIQFLKVPVVFINIKGGYGVHPRFSDKRRKGKIFVEVVKVWNYDEYKDLSSDEIMNEIKDKLYIDESTPSGPYKSKHSAEYLERVIYNCPHCGITKFYSNKQNLKCTTCGYEVRYNEYKQFEQVNKELVFKNVNEWYEYQKQYLYNQQISLLDENKLLASDVLDVYKVIARKKRELLFEKATLNIYPNRYEIISNNEKIAILFDDVLSTGVFGKNKLNIFVGNDIYQFKNNIRFNALKYVQILYKVKQEKGEIKDAFLGL